jgi:hypothetical protein
MNKYSLKIQNFLNTALSEYKTNNNYDDNNIIKLIKNIFNKVFDKNQTVVNIHTSIVKKLHSRDDYPLLYIILSNSQPYLNWLELNKNSEFSNITNFYKWIRENNSKINLQENKYLDFHDVLFRPCENRIELHNMIYKSIFVSLDVLQHSESENMNYKIYKNSNTEIHIYNPESNGKDDGPNVDLILKIIEFYRELTNKDLFVKLVVFYGSQKKQLSNEKMLCSDNVNSGSTIKGEIIQIWRKEEFYKVLIHELVHYFEIDFYVMDSIYKILNLHFKQIVNIKGIDRINESYTEIIAVTIHSVLYSKIKNTSLNVVLNLELMFSYFQVAKILHHFEYNSLDDVEKKNNITQSTSAFSYYIVKCMFFEKFFDVTQFWESNGFTILGNCESKYINLYKKIVRLDTLDKNKLIYFINLIKENDKVNSFVFKTMRMTMFQI